MEGGYTLSMKTAETKLLQLRRLWRMCTAILFYLSREQSLFSTRMLLERSISCHQNIAIYCNPLVSKVAAMKPVRCPLCPTVRCPRGPVGRVNFFRKKKHLHPPRTVRFMTTFMANPLLHKNLLLPTERRVEKLNFWKNLWQHHEDTHPKFDFLHKHSDCSNNNLLQGRQTIFSI